MRLVISETSTINVLEEHQHQLLGGWLDPSGSLNMLDLGCMGPRRRTTYGFSGLGCFLVPLVTI